MNKLEIEIPFDKYAEQMVLGCCINHEQAAIEILSKLTVNEFNDEKHKTIFIEIKALYKSLHAKGTKVDIHLLACHLKENDSLSSCGGLSYIVDLSHMSGSADWDSYADILLNKSNLRQLINLAESTWKEVSVPSAQAKEVTENIFKELYKIQGLEKSKIRTSREILENFSEHGSFENHLDWIIQQAKRGLSPYTGIASGFKELDKILGFFRPGCLYYIGARASMGKTTFMMNLVKGMASSDPSLPIGVFSLEMPHQILQSKLLCLMADVKFSSFEDGSISMPEVVRLKESSEILKNMKVFYEDKEDITISKLRNQARKMIQKHGVKVIFVDYLTRIKSDSKHSNNHLRVDEISKNLQSMAKELNVPVICLAQLNRASMTKSAPCLSDFRESGSIEEDCDGAILLHRPDYYDSLNFPGQVHVIVAKNRIRGRTRKISFVKSNHSECYHEQEDLGELVRGITKSYKEDDYE